MKTQSKMTQLILQQPVNLTNKQVAEKLGLTYNTVVSVRRRHIANYSVQARCPKDAMPELYRMILAGDAYSKIAKSIGITEQAVFYHAKKIGVSRSREYNNPEIKQKIIADYHKGLPIKVITLTHDCNVRIPVKFAKEAGILTRKKKQSSMHAKIISMFKVKMKVSAIAESVGCSNQTVYNVIKRAAN